MNELHDDSYEPKTYRLFIVLFGFMLLSILIGTTVLSDCLAEDIVMKLIYIDCCLVIIVISYIIDVKERIYWISSYSYNDAKNMSPPRGIYREII